jgi:predicted RNase H-like HicB family nuclease
MQLKNHYSYRTEWSEEDSCFIARVLEFPSLSAFGDTRTEAESELDQVIDEVLKWMKEDNESIPEPISHNKYKGNIALRIPSETHRNVAIMASNSGLSINQFITSLIERNIYFDSMSLFANSFENKLQSCINNIQKMTLINFEIFKRMEQLTTGAFAYQIEPNQNLDNIFTFKKDLTDKQLTI